MPIENGAPAGAQNGTPSGVVSERVTPNLRQQAIDLLGSAETKETAEVAAAEGAETDPNIDAAVAEVNGETATTVDTPAAKAKPANGQGHSTAAALAAKRAADFERRTQALAADREGKLRRQQEEQQWAQQQQANAQALQRAQLAAQDPLKYLETSGLPPEEIVKRAIASQDPNAKVIAELAELRTWRDQQAQIQQQQQQQFQAQQKQQEYFSARAHLETLVEKAPEAYPTLADLPPDYVSFKAYNIAIQYANDSGEVPDPEKVLAYLDKEERKRIDGRKKGRTIPAASAKQAPARVAAKKTPVAPPSVNGRASLRDERKARGLAVLERFKDDE